jgi:hypothetical protein
MAKLFEIDKDSIVKGTGGGYMYCTTTPEHPYGEKRGDRKKKYIYYHRALLEQKLGRYLKHDEQADHKDGDKTNNSPSNVILKNLGPHQKSHAERGNHFWKTSPANKKNTTKNKPKKKRATSIKEAAQRVVLRFLQS